MSARILRLPTVAVGDGTALTFALVRDAEIADTQREHPGIVAFPTIRGDGFFAELENAEREADRRWQNELRQRHQQIASRRARMAKRISELGTEDQQQMEEMLGPEVPSFEEWPGSAAETDWSIFHVPTQADADGLYRVVYGIADDGRRRTFAVVASMPLDDEQDDDFPDLDPRTFHAVEQDAEQEAQRRNDEAEQVAFRSRLARTDLPAIPFAEWRASHIAERFWLVQEVEVLP